MKKSKFLYLKDILIFGFIPITIVLVLFKLAIEKKIIDISESTLEIILNSITSTKLVSALVIAILILVTYKSIEYVLFIGTKRDLIPQRSYETISDWLSSFSIALIGVLVSTLVLTELQLSALTTWMAFVVVFLPLVKFKIRNSQNNTHNDNDQDESC
ncbi:TPA: hypothetical protein TXT63_001072 [Streptococcus suis]|nr:hypothetical protein [Streptococcus suis]